MLNIAARLSGAALAFLLTIMLARSMDPASFALVSVALAWLAVATVVGCAGMPFAVVRFVGERLAQGRPDLARGAILFSLGASCAAAALVTALAWIALHTALPGLSAQALAVADIGLALVIPNVLLAVVTGILQALNHALLAESLGSVLRSVLMLAGIAALWPGATGPKLAADTVFALYLGVAVILLCVAAACAFRLQRKLIVAGASSYEPRKWLSAGLGLLAVLAAAAGSERIDLMMLGWTASQAEVAVYAVAQRFAQTLVMALNALAVVLAPQFVATVPGMRAGNIAPAQEVVRTAAHLTLWTCLAAWVCFAVFGPWFTRLFGPAYASAYAPLMILASGQLLASLFGPALMVATLAGHVSLTLSSLGLGIVLNAAMNWIAVRYWGAVGAALATSAGVVASAALAQLLARRRLGLVTSFLAQPALRAARLPS